MKTLKFIWACLAVLGVSVCGISCSSDEDEPIVDETDYVIETPIPANPEVNKVYAIKHDGKSGKCTFQFYFGKTRAEELGEEYMGATVKLTALDNRRNVLFEYLLHAPDTPEDNLYTGAMLDTFTIYCQQCEAIRSFESTVYDGEDSFKDPVEVKQQYRAPHAFFN